jgi:mono/diheme cytochrome c family protein
MKLLLAGCAIVTLLAAAVVPSSERDPAFAAWDSGPGTIDVSSYPEEQQQNYALFASKCSTCHPLARPINSNFTATKWKRYMKRAARRAGADIGEEQAARINAFLEYHSARTRDPSAPRPVAPVARVEQ